MPSSNFGQSKISVTFVNSLDQSVIGVSDLSLDQLPANLSKQATFSLGDGEWSVIEAIPSTAQEIIQTAKLTLKLSKIEQLNSRKLLFSLPSLANKLPFMDCNSTFNAFTLEMHEDGWRQAEFLTRVGQIEIEQEIHAITNIWEHHREETDGSHFIFNKLHVRSKISTPHLNIDFAELQTILGSDKVGALKMSGQEDEFVEDGFAIYTPAGMFYGIVYDNNVELLGVHALSKKESVNQNTYPDKKEARQALQKLIQTIAKKYDLLFVNWCGCETIPATTLLS